MNPIPQKLHNPEFRFCKILPKAKKPFEDEWQSKRNYAFNDPILIDWINKGNNYGCIGGYGNLRVIDCDKIEFALIMAEKIGDTFSDRTGSGGTHFYILSDYDKNHVFKDEFKGELRAHNYQVVGPGSIHPTGNKYTVSNNAPIKFIDAASLSEILKPYIREDAFVTFDTNTGKARDESRSGKEYREILKMIKKGWDKEKIFTEMNVFAKWSAAHPQYREYTYKNALEWIEKKDQTKRNDEVDKEDLLEIIKQYIASLFKDQHGMAYATLIVDDHKETWCIKSAHFKNFIQGKIYKKLKEIPSAQTINSIYNLLEAEALFSGITREVHLRCAEENDVYYIDLCNEKWQVLMISSDEIKLLDDTPVLFKRYNHMKELKFKFVENPIKTLDKIFDFIPCNEEYDKILLRAHIVCLFNPRIQIPCIVFYGDPGTGKSTGMRIIRLCIDPSSYLLLSFTKDETQTVQLLAHHYICFFDNIRNIPSKLSDLFCRAITGGGLSKRVLYTDDEDFIYDLIRKLGFNGINIAVQESDLLDRSITVKLDKLDKTIRRKETDLYSEFNLIQPEISGAIIQLFQKTLKNIKRLKIKYLPRMADFALWGEAASISCDNKPGVFLNSYWSKIGLLNEEALEANPVAIALIYLCQKHRDLIVKQEMEFNSKRQQIIDEADYWEKGKEDWAEGWIEKNVWKGNASKLLKLLEEMAKELKISPFNNDWPKGPTSLSRKLNEVSKNLGEKGIKIKRLSDGKRSIEISVSSVIASIYDVEYADANGEKAVINGVSEEKLTPKTKTDSTNDDTPTQLEVNHYRGKSDDTDDVYGVCNTPFEKTNKVGIPTEVLPEGEDQIIEKLSFPKRESEEDIILC